MTRSTTEVDRAPAGRGRERCRSAADTWDWRSRATDLGEAPWEHVLEESREELGRGERAARHLSGATVTKPEGDATLVEVVEATIGDRDSEDMTPEVLEHLLTGASRLHVDDPVAGPGAGRDLIEQPGTAQRLAHLAAKHRREDVPGEEEVGMRRRDPAGAVGRGVPHR